MECSPAAVAYLSAVWITLAAWAAHNLLAASPEAPANVALDVLVVLAAAANRLLLVMCRPFLPVTTGNLHKAKVWTHGKQTVFR